MIISIISGAILVFGTRGKKKKELSFEDALKRLEVVISELESGKPTLDTMLSLYEEGIELSNYCKGLLSITEERITTLVNKQGKFEEKSGI